MKYTEGLLITLVTISLFIGIYRVYYHFVYRKSVNFARKLSTPKRILHILSWVFSIACLGIAAYLFVIPAQADSQEQEAFVWDDYTKPFVIIYDKPVRHSAVTHTFSKEVKGTWQFEKVNDFDVFKRKLVFYPEESLLPNEKVTFSSEYTLLLGMTSLKLHGELHGGKETPDVKVNDEVDDKQNVAPDQDIKVGLEQGNPLSYVLNFESTPPGLFDEEKRYRPQESNTIIPHNGLKNGQLYEAKIFLTPVSYNLKSKEIIAFGDKKLLKAFKFQTASTPQIKEILPKGDSVLSNEKIQISFDQEMEKASVEKGIIFEPAIEGHFEWSDDSTRISYVTDKPLQKEAKYKIILAGTIESIHGAKLSQVNETQPAVTQEFKTIGSVGVAGTTPASGTYNVDPTKTIITIKFNQDVDKPSAEAKFSITPAIDGKISWEGTTMSFKPNTEIKYAMKYTVTLAPGIKSVEGLDLKSSYTFSFTTKSKTVLLKAPIINQPAQFACNVTAAAIVLQFKGISVNPMDVYNGIPKQTAPKTINSWGNPNIGFVGNIYGSYGGDRTDGYGVYWDPIKNYISKYRPAEVKRGWNVADLLREVDQNNPSILWWQNGYATPTRLSWTAPDGSTVTGVNGMHSEVVVGYVGSPENPSQIILSDPWASRWNNQYRYININQFNSLWTYFGNTAVVVR